MRIATWNVNGIRARVAQVEEWIAREQPDVLCLQEIKATPEQVPATLRSLAGYRSHWHGSKGYSGVALLVREELAGGELTVTVPSFDFETRMVLTRLGGLDVASVYVPNGGKDFDAKVRFVNALIEEAGRRRDTGAPIVFCGDLNIARADIDVHPKERKPRAIGQRPEERALFSDLLAHDLVDVGRATSPEDEALFTWWAPWRNLRQRNIGWRIDYVLASRPVADRVRRCRVDAAFGTSDHAPVVADFDLV